MAQVPGSSVSGQDKSFGALALKTTEDIPSAIKNFATDVWNHPGTFVEHAVTEAVTSAAIGAAIGYLVPAKGPAALLMATAFTVPMIVGGVERVNKAYGDLQKPSGNLNSISAGLAADTVSSGSDLLINLGGGYVGTDLGVGLARSDSALGRFGQSAQRTVMLGENESLVGLKGLSQKAGDLLRSRTPASSIASSLTDLPPSPGGSSAFVNANLDQALDAVTPKPTVRGSTADAQPALWQRPFANMAARTAQYEVATRTAPVTEQPEALQMFFGSTHGHSRYSDGLGLPIDLYKKAIAEGQQVTTITDHNHLAARDGVEPGDPRSKDEAGTPIVAANPQEYVQTQQDAAATTVPGQHVSMYGLEMGTTGHPPRPGGGKGGGHDSGIDGGEAPDAAGIAGTVSDTATADADHDHEHWNMTPEQAAANNYMPDDWKAAQIDSLSASHLGGVNHINILETPTFFEAVRQPPTRGLVGSVMARLTGSDTAAPLQAPDVVKYNDGDYKGLVGHLQQLKDSTGQPPIITLNHPRFLADNNPALPADLRGRDYGRKSFANDDEWRSMFVKPYVRGIELIRGGALNPNPVDNVPVGMLDPESYKGLLGLGVEGGPLFGRDFHYGDPVGNPGATGFLASSLDKPSILDALRQRRTIATTNPENLSGYMLANDQFYMGSILDQAAVPDLNLKMKIGGQIDPNAKYQVDLYGDEQVLDGKNAQVVQSKTVTGQDLLNSNSEVAFDPISHKLGNNSLYFVEVQRTDPTANYTDRMWTSPVWVQPLSGADHDLATRLISGSAAQYLPIAKFH